MKKTINVNIGGYAFHIEEDAYEDLNIYLDSLKKGYADDVNGKEIMADIESRLGEILTEQKGNSEVIDMRMVALAKSRIGSPEDLSEGEDEGAENGRKKAKPKRKRLYRDIDRNTFGGVCAGLGHFFGIEATWIKLLFTLLVVGGIFFWDGQFAGITAVVYLVLWLCIPAAKTVEQKCEMVGQPLKITDYRDYEPARPVGNTGNGSYALRILGTLVGIFLLLTGGSILTGSVVVPFCSNFTGTVEIRNEINSNPDIPAEYADVIFNGLLCNMAFWWFVFANVFILSLLMIYEGIVLCFKIKRPSWHPGLVLLFLWILSVIALVIFTLYQFNPIMNFS